MLPKAYTHCLSACQKSMHLFPGKWSRAPRFECLIALNSLGFIYFPGSGSESSDEDSDFEEANETSSALKKKVHPALKGLKPPSTATEE